MLAAVVCRKFSRNDSLMPTQLTRGICFSACKNSAAVRHVNRQARAVHHVAIPQQTVQRLQLHVRRDAREVFRNPHERHGAQGPAAFEKLHREFVADLRVQHFGELGGNHESLRRQHDFAVLCVHTRLCWVSAGMP